MNYIEYISIPRPAEIRIIKIGEGFLFFIFLKIRAIKTKIARIIIPLKSGDIPPLNVVNFSSVLNAIVRAVARMSATTHGRTPRRKA